ncbi:nicotinate-nucleotide--dimethylbenzimidazole phosphoribosyltransferase [bacterium]|nr:nicotinate-nucleotide--dimethylbenzimidazole phosphoribosyltransferase [bacterium]
MPAENDTSLKINKASEYDTNLYTTIIGAINPVSKDLVVSAQHKIDNKTKPLGSLGTLEKLGVQAALIQNNLNPDIKRKLMLTFGADHGVTAEGISAYPSEVTYQMVVNFFHGGAAINVFCRAYDIDFRVVDMGVKGEFEDQPMLIKRKIGEGTRNFALQPAMTLLEAQQAIETGMEVFLCENSKNRVDILGLGEIGIGNTTSATAIICAVAGVSPGEATGRGTGLDDKGLKHKADVIQRALDFHQLNSKDGLEILSLVGGFEIGGIAGAILAAASKKTIVVLDGVISTSAGLIAYLINPDIKDYLVSGHKSVEVAQKSALEYMQLDPVLDLDMRLGEGTGAAITINIVETACKIMREMASFDEAGVSKEK